LLRYVVVVVVAVLPAACATPAKAEDSPERAVEQVFEAYRSAILDSEGNVAADLVTEETWTYYRGLADRALTADRTALKQEHVVDRIGILLLRQDLSPDRLQSMTGRELFAHGVDRGWVSKHSTLRIRLTNYRVDGNSATAQMVGRNGEASDVTVEFLEQEGRWRFDVAQMIAATRPAMKLAIQLSGMTEEDLVNKAIEDGTGRKPGPEIWSPPL
jgi:hypothetical protein